MAENENKTNLIINYLPQTMTDEDFKCMFITIGPVKSAKIIRDKSTAYSFGFGFVDYTNSDDAQRAIQTLNGLQIQNKTIKVALAKLGDEADKQANLYVRNVPKDFKEPDLEALFKDYGTIVQSRVLIDLQTGESKGVGFVLYSKKAEADNAIEGMNGKFPPGSDVPFVVKFADDSTKKVKPVQQNNNIGGGGMGRQIQGMGGGGGGQAGPMRNPPGNRMRFNPMGQGGANMNNYGGNQQYGGPGPNTYNGPNSYNGPGPNSYNGPNNYGAQQQNAYNPPPGPTGFGGMQQQHHQQQQQQQQQQQMNQPAPAPGGGGGYGGLTGNLPQPAGTGHLAPGGGYIIHAYNIGYDCTEEELRELFKPFGTVARVNVMYDHQRGQCKGFGFVTMTNYREAQNAILNLNGYIYKGRNLSISFKKSKDSQ